MIIKPTFWDNYTHWVYYNRKEVYYKYHSCRDYTFDSLYNNEIYVSSFEELNDPFDPYASILWKDDPWGEWKDINASLIILNSSNFPRIFCVSETYKSELMWSHYANSHRGFCIGYGHIAQSLLKVVYTSKILDAQTAMVNNGGVLGQNWKFVIKNRPWAYEKEWRYPFPGLPDEKGVSIQTTFVIKEVIFGARMSISDMKLLADITQQFKPKYRKVFAEIVNDRCLLIIKDFDLTTLR